MFFFEGLIENLVSLAKSTSEHDANLNNEDPQQQVATQATAARPQHSFPPVPAVLASGSSTSRILQTQANGSDGSHQQQQQQHRRRRRQQRRKHLEQVEANRFAQQHQQPPPTESAASSHSSSSCESCQSQQDLTLDQHQVERDENDEDDDSSAGSSSTSSDDEGDDVDDDDEFFEQPPIEVHFSQEEEVIPDLFHEARTASKDEDDDAELEAEMNARWYTRKDIVKMRRNAMKALTSGAAASKEQLLSSPEGKKSRKKKKKKRKGEEEDYEDDAASQEDSSNEDAANIDKVHPLGGGWQKSIRMSVTAAVLLEQEKQRKKEKNNSDAIAQVSSAISSVSKARAFILGEQSAVVARQIHGELTLVPPHDNKT